MDWGLRPPFLRNKMASAHNQPVPSPLPAQGVSSPPSDGVVFPSAARIQATYTSDPMYNPVCKGVRIYFASIDAGAGTATIQIQTQDPNSKNWVPMLTGVTPAWTAAGTVNRTLTVYPGLTAVVGTATTNTVANDFLSLSWRITVVVGTATLTFSVGAEYL